MEAGCEHSVERGMAGAELESGRAEQSRAHGAGSVNKAARQRAEKSSSQEVAGKKARGPACFVAHTGGQGLHPLFPQPPQSKAQGSTQQQVQKEAHDLHKHSAAPAGTGQLQQRKKLCSSQKKAGWGVLGWGGGEGVGRGGLPMRSARSSGFFRPANTILVPALRGAGREGQGAG